MIINRTTGETISTKENICKTLLKQARGLMFSKKKVLLFPFKKQKKIVLHNFFVFYPLTLLFLDDTKKIIEIKKNFKPFTVYSSKKRATYLIETPYSFNGKIGDVLEFR